jgi:hypothetical protein
MTARAHTILVIPTPEDFPPPMLAYCPEASVGVAPRAHNDPTVIWFAVDADGLPIEPGAVPEPADSSLRDMLLFRLAEAYSALAHCRPGHAPAWKA